MSRAKILLVDDDSILLHVFREVLEQSEFDVVEASDYEQAIGLMDASVDIVLEGKSGMEILSYIHQQFPLCPVIIISGHANKNNAIDALRKGAVDYLEKPLTLTELRHVVEHWLSFRTLKAENIRLLEEQKIQHELRESDLRYHRLIEAIPDGVLIACENSIVFANSAATNLLKATDMDELIGAKLLDIAGPECRECLAEQVEQSLQEQTSIPMQEGTLLKRNGALFDAQFSITHTAYLDKDAVQLMIQDISERKQAEEQLDEQRRSLQAILETAPVGIWRLGVDERMTFINATFCNAVGVEERRFLEAKHYSELLPEDISRGCMASDNTCFDSRAQVSSIEEIPCVDGKLHSFEIIKAPIINDQGEMLGLVGLATDVTERKESEEALQQQMQKLQRFNTMSVGRELRMIELKKEMNALLAELGREPKYVIHKTKDK